MTKLKRRRKNRTSPQPEETAEGELCLHLLDLAARMRMEKVEFWVQGLGARLFTACGRCQTNVLLETYEADE